jgi:hypothetical protein
VIPRYQKILFGALLVTSVAMGVALWQLRERAHERLIAGQNSAPTQAPEVAPAEQATLLVANDSDGSLMPQTHSLPLPADPEARAQALLGSLLDLYAAPDATHPVPGGASSVLQVFLLPAPALGGVIPANGQPKFPASGSGSSIAGGKDLRWSPPRLPIGERRADRAAARGRQPVQRLCQQPPLGNRD